MIPKPVLAAVFMILPRNWNRSSLTQKGNPVEKENHIKASVRTDLLSKTSKQVNVNSLMLLNQLLIAQSR